MRKWIAVLGLSLLVALVAIQFVPVDTSNPPVIGLLGQAAGLDRLPTNSARRPCARDASLCRILQGHRDEVLNT